MPSSPSTDRFHFWTLGTIDRRDYAQHHETDSPTDALRLHSRAAHFDWAHDYQRAYVSELWHHRPDGTFIRKPAMHRENPR